MEKKILELLMQRYANYGLSKELLNLYSISLSAGLSDDADDAEIEKRITSVDAIFKATQSFGDKREGDGRKAATKTPKGDNGEPNPPEHQVTVPTELTSLMEEMKKERAMMEDRIAQLEGNMKADVFNKSVKKIAKELGLSGDMFDLAKAKLSADMDEDAIRANLGESKKMFIKMGAIREDRPGNSETSEQVKRKEASDWVKAHEVKNE